MTCPPAWKKEYLPAIRTYAEPPLCAEHNIVTVTKDAKNASWKADRKRHSKTQELAPCTQTGRYQAQTITLENRNTY